MLINLFFLFFLIIAVSSILVSNPVLSVLCLVLVFVLGACFIVGIGLDYLGILLLLIYVGAISVLFLFVVMMLNVRQTELNQSLVRFWWLGLLISFFFFFEIILCVFDVWGTQLEFFFHSNAAAWISHTSEINNVELLGEFLFFYNWDFLILSIVLLLVAVIGPVYISQIETKQIQADKKMTSWDQTIRSKIESFQI